jgi:dephospho-CoA kinase
MGKIILASVGQIASGKGVFVDYIKEKFNSNSYKFSTPLRNILDRIGEEQSRENMQDLSTILRERFGQDLLAKIIVKDAQEDSQEVVLVDGVRRVADIKYLKELEGFYLINVQADEKIRYERIKSRGENPGDKEKTWEEFQKDAQAETEVSIREVAEQASFTIENNGSLEEYHNQIEKIINEIKD